MSTTTQDDVEPNADYIRLHRGDAKLLLESLNYIRLATGRILDAILENQSLPEVRAA